MDSSPKPPRKSSFNKIRRLLGEKDLTNRPPTIREEVDSDRWVVELGIKEEEDLSFEVYPDQYVPSMWAEPQMKGWMWKEGHIIKNWKWRWFILQHNNLFYFKQIPTQLNRKPSGWIILTNSQIYKVDFKPFTLRIDDRTHDKYFHITFSNMEECSQWESALIVASTKSGNELNNVKKAIDLSPEIMGNLDRYVSTEDPLGIYSELTVISTGGGSSQVVYGAVDKRSGRKVAIKSVDVTAGNLRYLLPEIAHHKELIHPNVVQFVDCYFRLDSKQLWIVLERMETSLYAIISKSMRNYRNKVVGTVGHIKLFSEPQIAFVTYPILEALSFLHLQQKVHRDVKSGNILISNSGREIKLGDFGFVAQLNSNGIRKTFVGTPPFMAPEMISSNPYDCSVDIWSLGVTIVEMCEGVDPFQDSSKEKTLQNIVERKFKGLKHREWSDNMRNLLSLMLESNPQKRATAEELLLHPFFETRKLVSRISVVQ